MQIFSLREFLDVTDDESRIIADLSTFKCSRDSDIEHFLIKTAIPFEKAHKSRTYLVLDKKKLLKNEVNILAYFTVGMDHLLIKDAVSKSMKRKLNGIFSDDRVPCYLLGQLGKNDRFKDEVSGDDILNGALSVLLDAHELIGGRFVRVDCKDIDDVLDFYKRNNFTLLPDKEDGYNQLVRFIDVKK